MVKNYLWSTLLQKRLNKLAMLLIKMTMVERFDYMSLTGEQFMEQNKMYFNNKCPK